MFLCLSQKRKGDGESLRGGDEKKDTSQVRGKESDEKRENVHFLTGKAFNWGAAPSPLVLMKALLKPPIYSESGPTITQDYVRLMEVYKLLFKALAVSLYSYFT